MWEELLKRGASGAPQGVEWLAIAIGIGLATFVGRFTLFRGQREREPRVSEIAGAVIDAGKADEMIKALDANTLEMANLASAVKASSRAVSALAGKLEQNTDATRAMREMTDEARTDVRELKREIVSLAARQQ